MEFIQNLIDYLLMLWRSKQVIQQTKIGSSLSNERHAVTIIIICILMFSSVIRIWIRFNGPTWLHTFRRNYSHTWLQRSRTHIGNSSPQRQVMNAFGPVLNFRGKDSWKWKHSTMKKSLFSHMPLHEEQLDSLWMRKERKEKQSYITQSLPPLIRHSSTLFSALNWNT